MVKEACFMMGTLVLVASQTLYAADAAIDQIQAQRSSQLTQIDQQTNQKLQQIQQNSSQLMQLYSGQAVKKAPATRWEQPNQDLQNWTQKRANPWDNPRNTGSSDPSNGAQNNQNANNNPSMQNQNNTSNVKDLSELNSIPDIFAPPAQQNQQKKNPQQSVDPQKFPNIFQ